MAPFNRNKSLAIIVVLGIVSIVLGYFIVQKRTQIVQSQPAQWEGYRIISKEIDGTSYQLAVADTPEKQTKGLMYVRKPTGIDGMIFPNSTPSIVTFWNKNTLVDLTLVWMRDDIVVGKSKLPSIEKSKQIVTRTSPEAIDAVVELIE